MGLDELGGGVGGVLGRSVEVPDGLDAGLLVEGVDEGSRERLAGEADDADAGWDAEPEELGHGGGDGVDEDDVVLGGKAG